MSAPEIINPPGGGGGGTVTGTGTPGKLAKFTGTGTSIGNSLLSESGTTITSAATAETFGGAQTWTLGAPNAFALIVKSNAGPESTLVLDTISRAVGIGGAPGTLLHVQDAAGYPFAGSTYAGVRLQRSTEALFSASDYTRSFRAGLTGSTAVVGTSTSHDLLLQRGNVTAATLQTGAIATVTLTAGGTLYTNGTYSQQALTGGTGTGATADIVVAGGIVTSCVLRSPGSGYAAADALSCATIGAGAGFVLTVATIAQIVAGSGNLTALGRIGAGTATPRAALDVVGGGAFIEGTEFTALNLWSGVTVTSSVSAAIGKGTEAALDLPSGSTRNTNLYVGRRINANAAGTTTNTGIGTYPAFETAGVATTTYLTGASAFPVRSFAADATSNASLTGFLGGCTIQSTAGCTNTLDASAFIAQLNLSKAGHTTATAQHFDATLGNVGTVSTMTSVRLRPITGLGTIVTFYGLRMEATTAQTITNRWGISQEDTLARNVLSGATVIGAAAGTSPATGTKLDVLGLTANRAAGTYTIQPTAWWAGDVYSQLVVDSTAETGGLTKPTTGPGYIAAIASIPRYDLSLRGTTAVYGIQSQPLLESATLTGTSYVTALDGSTNLNQSGITAKTIDLVGVSGQASISAAGATVTAALTGVISTVGNFATTAVAHSSVAQFLGTASTFSGAAHTITNFYGLRLRTTTLSGGATITNRWGISQEDTLASNQFSAVTNTFSGIVRATGSTAAAPAFSTPADTDTGLYFPSANTVRIATAGSPGLEIDSSQNLKFNSGYGSTATAYGCRAWVNFDGTLADTFAGGASTVTRVAASTTATVTTTTAHGLVTGNRVYPTSGVVPNTTPSAGYIVTVLTSTTFTITTVATTALTAVAITFAGKLIRGSGNVSSIADIGTGLYSINFITAMPDINYAWSGTKQQVATNTSAIYDTFTVIAGLPALPLRTANVLSIACWDGAVQAASPNVNIAVFR